MKKADLCILAAVIAAAVILLFAMGGGSSAGYAVVYVNDAEYARLPLDEAQVLTVDQGEGKINVVEVFGGGVRMQSASCGNQLCVLQGDVTEESAAHAALKNWIVCLPNGVSVELVTEDAP